MSNQDDGRWGENQAAQLLQARGYQIVESRFRIRRGEVDLVAFRKGVLTFVEVKVRCQPLFSPDSWMTLKKRMNIRRTAQVYLAQLNQKPKAWAQQVVEVDFLFLAYDGRAWSVFPFQVF